MPEAFVTGGAGFVGSALVRELRERGWQVRVLVRTAAPALAGLDCRLITGDLFHPELAAAMAGCDALFHVAATYSLWRRDAATVRRANVAGTRAVLAAARTAGVGRVVHTSSVAAIGVRPDGQPADETFQSPPGDLIGAYKQSKHAAEEAVREAVAAGLDAVIVNPTTPVGPGDAKPTPTGAIVLRFLTGRMPAYVDTGLNLVDVRDVARAHIAAYERGRRGERYIIGNENLTLREILQRLAAISGRPAPRLRLPHLIPLAYAAAGEFLLAPLGIRPDVPVDAARMAKERMYYDGAKAVRELSLTLGDVTQALADAVAWFRANGYAPPGG